MGYIYKITNTINNKCYIGETIQLPRKRWSSHKSSTKRNGGCKALKLAINKYGLENFTFEVLTVCLDRDRFIYEKQYIKEYNSIVPNGYNMLAGGQEGILGFKHSEETKIKLSKINKLRFANTEERKKSSDRYRELNVSNNLTNIRNNSPKWIKALHENRIGRRGIKRNKLTQDIKKKISDSLKLYYATNINCPNREKWQKMLRSKKGVSLNKTHKDNISSGLNKYFNKQYELFYNEPSDTNIKDSRTKLVGQYSLEEKLVKIYPSVAEAARSIGIKSHYMGKILRRKNNVYNNSIWKYYNKKNLKT